MPQTFNVGARSRFVTATAWAAIVLALLACSAALVRWAAAASLPLPLLPGAGVPTPLAGWLLAYLPGVLAAGLAVCAATLGAAVGLLLRREWARRVFIALLLAAMAVNLGGLWLQQELMAALVQTRLQHSPLPAPVAGLFDGFVMATRSAAGLLTLAASALLGWAAWRLTRAPVRQEFA